MKRIVSFLICIALMLPFSSFAMTVDEYKQYFYDSFSSGMQEKDDDLLKGACLAFLQIAEQRGIVIEEQSKSDVKQLSDMSLDDMIETMSSIQGEMIARGALKSAYVPAGIYTVGIDIPAGNYSVKNTDENANMYGEAFEVYKSEKDYDSSNWDVHYNLKPDAEVGKVTLKDGNIVRIHSGMTFTVYSGIVFK